MTHMTPPDSNNPPPPWETPSNAFPLSDAFLRSLFSEHKSMREGKDMELVDLEILEDTTTDDESITGNES